MEIKREKNSVVKDQYIYTFTENDRTLKILFAGNLDLYISIYDNSLRTIKENEKKDFYITKENYAIYSLFEELYEKIITGNVYPEDSAIFKYTNNLNSERNLRTAIEKGLINYDDEIEWYCDDYSMGEGDSMKIIKEDDRFKILFERHKSPEKGMYEDLYVRICNSGSRYLPFNSCFMDFYNKLQKIDPDNYQMHLEEFIYKQKVKK